MKIQKYQNILHYSQILKYIDFIYLKYYQNNLQFLDADVKIV